MAWGVIDRKGVQCALTCDGNAAAVQDEKPNWILAGERKPCIELASRLFLKASGQLGRNFLQLVWSPWLDNALEYILGK